MDAETLELIRRECEKIEADPGFGKVLISIVNGCVEVIQPTPTIKLNSGYKSHKLLTLQNR